MENMRIIGVILGPVSCANMTNIRIISFHIQSGQSKNGEGTIKIGLTLPTDLYFYYTCTKTPSKFSIRTNNQWNKSEMANPNLLAYVIIIGELIICLVIFLWYFHGLMRTNYLNNRILENFFWRREQSACIIIIFCFSIAKVQIKSSSNKNKINTNNGLHYSILYCEWLLWVIVPRLIFRISGLWWFWTLNEMSLSSMMLFTYQVTPW